MVWIAVVVLFGGGCGGVGDNPISGVVTGRRRDDVASCGAVVVAARFKREESHVKRRLVGAFMGRRC